MNHIIGSRGFANVRHVFIFVGGVENHGTRRGGLFLTVDVYLEGAFLDDNEFLLRMAVERPGVFAGIERRDMAVEFVERRRRRVEHRHACAGGGGGEFLVLPEEDLGDHFRGRRRGGGGGCHRSGGVGGWSRIGSLRGQEAGGGEAESDEKGDSFHNQ